MTMVECEHDFELDVVKITAFPRDAFYLRGSKCKVCDQKRDIHAEKIRDMREPDCFDVGHDWHDESFCKRCGVNLHDV